MSNNHNNWDINAYRGSSPWQMRPAIRRMLESKRRNERIGPLFLARVYTGRACQKRRYVHKIDFSMPKIHSRIYTNRNETQ